MNRAQLLVILVLNGIAFSTVAAKAQDEGKLTLSEKHKAWTLGCYAKTAKTVKRCGIHQETVDSQGRGSNAALFYVVKKGDNVATQYVFEFLSPLGLLVDRNMEVELDRRAVGETHFLYCKQNGCRADFDLSGNEIEPYLNGREMIFRVKYTPDKALEYKFSLYGLTSGTRQLEK